MSNNTTTGKVYDWPLFKRVLRLARPFKKQFLFAVVLAIIIAILTPAQPFLIQLTVDEFILKNDGEGLVNMALLLIGVLVMSSVLRYYFIYITNWLGQSVIKGLRENVFKHIVSLNLGYFDRTPIGTSTTRTINDIETINDIFAQGIITIISDMLTLITVALIMFYTDWKLALISISVFPVLLVAVYIFKEKMKAAFQIVRTQVALLNSFLQEHITGMNIVHIFNAEEIEMQKFIGINDAHKKAHISTIWYNSIFFPVVEIILAASIGLMVWFGTYRVISGHTTLGVLIAFILYIYMLFRPIRMLAEKINTLQMGLVAASRVFKLMDKTSRIENSGNLTVSDLKGDITFKNVWFAYSEENYILKDITFNLEAGKTLAIVGVTGAGKTSIINILCRFYEIQKGAIHIDGRSIKEYDLESLRSKIGLVLQDVFLFSGSILENITLRNREISLEEVIAASKIVGAHEFISKLPGKYDFNVRERGVFLSLGQRQLISFIRALVFNPKILILDEATSSVDTESEQLIQGAIKQLISNRTSIVIAHRLSTIQRADNIIVLDKGVIKEMGTHNQLMKINGYYKRLYELQYQKTH